MPQHVQNRRTDSELSEAEAMFVMLSDVAEPHRTALGTSAVRFAGGVVLSMAHDPVNYWSKALGFGHTSPVDTDLIQRIIDTFLTAGVTSATLQLAPHVLPADWMAIAARHGLQAESTWVKLAGEPPSARVGEAAIVPAAKDSAGNNLRIGRVERADINEWATVIFRGFGMPPAQLSSLLVAAASSPSTHPFAVWDGDFMVAGASLVVRGDVGHLAGAATLESARGRGAQRALIAARVQAAREFGVRRLYAETAKPNRPGGNTSLNNLSRAGLQPLYERTNWRWTATSQ
jgi:GNAT superfamily N-acetyltransferase